VTAFTALLGAGVGLGLVLVIGGWRTTEHGRTLRPGVLSRLRRDRLTARTAGAAGAAVLVGAITGWPVAAVLAGAGAFALPTLFRGVKDRTRQVARTEAIAGWAEMLRDTLSAAAGLEQAIVATAAVAPLAIRPEVAALSDRLARQRLVPALRSFATDLADPTGDLVVVALVLAAGHEARRLSELLGSLAGAARDQAAMQLRIEAGRARIRTSTRVVVGSTLAFAAGLILLNRSYLSPFGTPLGQAVLAVIGLLFGSAFWWLARLGRPASLERFLTVGEQPPDDDADQAASPLHGGLLPNLGRRS
jgi:Flp pilus assembly protein TadB